MICLISGVDTFVGTPSSGAMVDEAEDPEIRTVLDNSDNRVSGLLSEKYMRRGGTFWRRGNEKERRGLTRRHVAIYNDQPFCEPNIERRSW